MRVLVTYASTHGSTRGIAEHIATRMRDSGISADCVPIHEAQSVANVDAVVVGSAIHDQARLPEASHFLATHANELVRKPVWLYSVGMPGAIARPLRKMAMREGPKVVASFASTIRLRDTQLFSGVVRKRQFPLVSRAVLRLMGGRYGDFRNWPEIDAWTARICSELLQTSAPPRRAD